MRSAASTCGLWRLWCACGLLVAGCTASADEVRAPQDQLFFPSGLALSPDGTALFVANANSELRYDSGSINVIDTARIDEVLAARERGEIPSDCAEDPERPETLVCDEASFLRLDAGVRIGNFATDIAIQDFSAQTGSLRLFIPTRGDPSIAWADYVGGRLRCGAGEEPYQLCDDAHRLLSLQNDPDLPTIPDEPFGVYADGANELAMVTHLTSGAVTLISAPSDSSNVRIVDLVANVFADQNTVGSATGIAGRASGSPDAGPIVYVGSRTEDRIQTFTIGKLNDEPTFLIPGSSFFLDAVGNNAGLSNDTRGMQFSPSGDRLYLVNRRPPTLQIYDTSVGPTGVPQNVSLGASDICRGASTVTVAGEGADERAYVTCFQDGEVYVVDPRRPTGVPDIITVGRGPYAVAAARVAPKHLYVSNVLEDTIAVIDVDPASMTHNRVVLRIGKAKTL